MSGRAGRGAGMFLVFALASISLLFLAYLVDEAAMHGMEYLIGGLMGLGGMGWLLLRGPVGKALAAMLEGSGSDQLAQRVQELELRLAESEHRAMTSGEVDQAYARLAELEERLDFTERLLATQTNALPRGGMQ
ncbi:MAG TPA: hypothetical protein VFN90_07525 [Gemmatimonadales bacterium]|nr:hypothetical protein [Gemmatimonadales bacterium]